MYKQIMLCVNQLHIRNLHKRLLLLFVGLWNFSFPGLYVTELVPLL